LFLAVRVRLENDKPVSARSLTVAVRCYEARVGRFGASSPSRCIAEFSQTLWTGAGGPVERPSSSRSRPSTAAIAANASANAGAAVYADLYDHEASFRITIPTHASGHSMATYPDYKVYWRVEAGLSLPCNRIESSTYVHVSQCSSISISLVLAQGL
jgi:hypothetical protein